MFFYDYIFTGQKKKISKTLFRHIASRQLVPPNQWNRCEYVRHSSFSLLDPISNCRPHLVVHREEQFHHGIVRSVLIRNACYLVANNFTFLLSNFLRPLQLSYLKQTPLKCIDFKLAFLSIPPVANSSQLAYMFTKILSLCFAVLQLSGNRLLLLLRLSLISPCFSHKKKEKKEYKESFDFAPSNHVRNSSFKTVSPNKYHSFPTLPLFPSLILSIFRRLRDINKKKKGRIRRRRQNHLPDAEQRNLPHFESHLISAWKVCSLQKNESRNER